MGDLGHGARGLGDGPLTPTELGLDDAIAEFERRAAHPPRIGRRRWTPWVVGVLTVALLGWLIAYDFVLHDAFAGIGDGASVNGVYDACNRFVAERLDSRARTVFAPIDVSAITVDGGYGTDFSYVDTAAASGARTRVPFSCEVRYDGDGGWTLSHLDVNGSP